MASKKWIIASSVVAMIGAGLVFLGIAGNKMFHEGFKKALVATGRGATGGSFSIGESELNIFTGRGAVKRIVVASVPGEATGSAFEVYDVSFDVRPLSLVYGIIDVTALTIGELKVVASLSRGISSINKMLVAALAFSKIKDGDYSETRLVVRKLNIQKGDLRVDVKVLGKLITKSTSLPPVNMDLIGGSDDGVSPAFVAYEILKEVGSSVVNKALKNL